MRPNKLRQLLNEGKSTIGTHVHSVWPAVIEVLGHSGQFDYVEFVAEYTSYTLPDLENLVRAAELHDLSSMIKVDQSGQDYWAQRAIGVGFQSVLFTDVRSAADMEECVRLVRPETPEHGGTFGIKATRTTYMRDMYSAEYIDALNDVVIAVMIEKRQAVEQLHEILSVPGLDMIQVGPTDYAMSVGKLGQPRGDEWYAVERQVVETALDMGVVPRAEIRNARDAQRHIEMGVRHFCMGTDTGILYDYWRSEGEGLRALVPD